MLDVAVRVAKEAGALLKGDFKKIHQVSSKADRTMVSEADLKSEKLIVSSLQEEFPDFAFFSEEMGAIKKDSDYEWIIDPLDGSSNYARQIPHFCVQIALRHKDEIVLGVVYNPMANELFSAEKGKGAFLNEEKIHVSDRAEIGQAVVSADREASEAQRLRHARIYSRLYDAKVKTVRAFGTAAINQAYVAAGRFDASINNGAHLYDVAPTAIIVEEAGGAVTDFKGKKWEVRDGDFLVANKLLSSELVKILKDA